MGTKLIHLNSFQNKIVSINYYYYCRCLFIVKKQKKKRKN